ncbi:hypothetical protein F5887DRAFT_922279 [Amanita rubescens]|nr:hypothetical protein F5887DRAFT_922279 [Amanita rubescens]
MMLGSFGAFGAMGLDCLVRVWFCVMSGMEIRLQTPPASPVLLSLDDLPSPESIIQKNVKKQSYTVISPQKKPRHPGTGSKKSCQKRTTDTFQAGDEDDSFYGAHPVDDDSSQYGLNSIDGLPESSIIGHPSAISPTAFDATDSDELEYYTYVESVLDFVAGLFQVSATVFVVQGWDMKRASATKTRPLSSVAVHKGISIEKGIASM